MAGQQVFLSYYHENKAEAERLRADLLAAGYEVWWDQLLEPDQDLYVEMSTAMDESRVLLVCLSQKALAKTTAGIYQQARDAIEFYPVYELDAVVVIPIRFSECIVPSFSIDETRTLDQLASVDLFPAAQWKPGLMQLQAKLRRAMLTAPKDPPAQAPDTLMQQRLARSRRGETQHEITQILLRAYRGDTGALNRLWSIVYNDIKQIAHRELQGERRDQVLSTTALVHEAYIKLADHKRITWRNRKHFYALSCKIMKRILIDRARRRDALKREGRKNLVSLDEARHMSVERSDRLLDLHEALEKLAKMDPRLGKIVECIFFGGLTVAETAEALGMAKRTVEREWRRARTYLYQALNPNPNDS